MSTSMDAGDAKKKAARLFLDIWDADRRLHVIDVSAVAPLVDAAVTFDIMEGKVVFQGAQLSDALLARHVPHAALVSALVVLEPRAAKIGVAVRQPADIRRLTFDEKQAIAQQAPPSSSAFLEELDRQRTPRVVREAKGAPRRRKLLLVAGVVVVIAAGVATIVSLPKGLDDVKITFSDAAVPCVRTRSANHRIFCYVDEAKVKADSDEKLHVRMEQGRTEALQAGYQGIAYLRQHLNDDGEQHRFKPWLWEREPVKPGLLKLHPRPQPGQAPPAAAPAPAP